MYTYQNKGGAGNYVIRHWRRSERMCVCFACELCFSLWRWANDDTSLGEGLNLIVTCSFCLELTMRRMLTPNRVDIARQHNPFGKSTLTPNVNVRPVDPGLSAFAVTDTLSRGPRLFVGLSPYGSGWFISLKPWSQTIGFSHYRISPCGNVIFWHVFTHLPFTASLSLSPDRTQCLCQYICIL